VSERKGNGRRGVAECEREEKTGSVVDAAARVTAGMAPPVDVIPASASLVLPSPVASSPAAVHGVVSSSETTTSSSYMVCMLCFL
jgi:hypothetical protein